MPNPHQKVLPFAVHTITAASATDAVLAMTRKWPSLVTQHTVGKWLRLFAWRSSPNFKLKGNTMSKIKLPFQCMVGTESEKITNPFSGQSITLQPEAVAVYDTIMGCQLIGDYKTMQKGLDWFRRHFPEAYMVLLD